MSLFKKDGDEPKVAAIIAKIESVSRDLAELKGERAGVKDELELHEQIVKLKKELTDLQIARDKEKEAHDRVKREIEHKVGLHKKQVEHEMAAAKKDTELAVKEQNLVAEKERFEKEMTFMRDRFETEVGYLREMMGEVLNRLPNVEVSRTYETVEHIGDQSRSPSRSSRRKPKAELTA